MQPIIAPGDLAFGIGDRDGKQALAMQIEPGIKRALVESIARLYISLRNVIVARVFAYYANILARSQGVIVSVRERDLVCSMRSFFSGLAT